MAVIGGCDQYSKKGAKWIGDHKENIAKASIAFAGAAAATALTVSTFGVGAGAVVAIAATAGGTIGMVSSDQNEGNALDGFSRGMLVGTVGAIGAVANPVGAFLGGTCQLATDSIRGQVSSPEAYAGAMFGGAVGTEIGSAFLGGFTATGMGELLEKATKVKNYSYVRIIMDSVVTGAISACLNWVTQKALPYDLAFWFQKSLSERERDFIETILAAIGISGYFEKMDSCIQ